MNLEVGELPSSNISLSNCSARIKECSDYFQKQQWFQFSFLFKVISQFAEENQAKMQKSDLDNVEKMRNESTESILKTLETTTTFEDFQLWLTRLSDIVVDKRRLWDIIHSEANLKLRVAIRQTHEIAAAYFTPKMLFEFGIKSFLMSSTCSFDNVANEEALIDIFYGIAGYIRACALERSYETHNEDFFEYMQRLYDRFIALNDFDAHRFVWLVEASYSNLHIPSEKLQEICEKTIQKYVEDEDGKTLTKLYKLCVFSTSPFMSQFDLVKDSINQIFAQLIDERRFFLRKYIFSNFALINWNEHAGTEAASIPMQCWKLYVTNLASRMSDKPEIPSIVMTDLLDDSLVLFVGYYGDIQTTQEKSIQLRADLFTIADIVQLCYPPPIPEDTLQKIWYLLFFAAAAGATDEDIAKIHPSPPPEDNVVFLGLEHTASDFINYPMALNVFASKFKDELDAFHDMAVYVRANFASNEQQQNAEANA